MIDKKRQGEDHEHNLTLAHLRGLRSGIDAGIKDARDIAETRIQRGTGGRELALAITNLQQAKMWVEQAQRELGVPPTEFGD
jgi:hypothetical protein